MKNMEIKMRDLAPTAVIAGLYREVPLNTRIFTKGLMYPSLQMETNPGLFLEFQKKYETRQWRGQIKHMIRRRDQMNRAYEEGFECKQGDGGFKDY
jgi:hypothetical protein